MYILRNRRLPERKNRQGLPAFFPEDTEAIHARLAEGYTQEDFRAVIDRKCADWLADARMVEYLRPETLFGTKFESYLNAGGNYGTIADVSDENRVGHYL